MLYACFMTGAHAQGWRCIATAVCCDTSLFCTRARWRTIRKHGDADTSRNSFYIQDKGSIVVLKEVTTVKQLKRLLFVECEGFTAGKDATLKYKRLVLTCDADAYGYIIVEQLIWLLLCFRQVFYSFLVNPSSIIQLSPFANYYPNDKTLGFKRHAKKMLFDVREVLEFLQTEGVNTKRLLRFKGTGSMGEPHMHDLAKRAFTVTRKNIAPVFGEPDPAWQPAEVVKHAQDLLTSHSSHNLSRKQLETLFPKRKGVKLQDKRDMCGTQQHQKRSANAAASDPADEVSITSERKYYSARMQRLRKEKQRLEADPSLLRFNWRNYVYSSTDTSGSYVLLCRYITEVLTHARFMVDMARMPGVITGVGKTQSFLFGVIIENNKLSLHELLGRVNQLYKYKHGDAPFFDMVKNLVCEAIGKENANLFLFYAHGNFGSRLQKMGN